MSNYYGGLIFTNHALQRMSERYLPQHLVLEAFTYPDQKVPGKQPGATEFRKRFERSTVTVIAKKNDQGEWVVLSCWIDPPLPGTKDYQNKQRYHAYKRAGFWRKIWLTIKSQLGL